MRLWRSELADRLIASRSSGDGRSIRRSLGAAVRSLSFSGRIGAAVVAVLVILAIFDPWLEPHDPNGLHVGPLLAGPSAAFPMGTDAVGRDVFSRVLAGTRVSLTIGVLSVFAALVLAVVIGSVAAVTGKIVSETIMRLLDVIMAFPAVIIAVCVASVIRPGTVTTIGVIAVLFAPPLARVVRASVLAEYSEAYVDAARSGGSSHLRTLVRHVAVNSAAPILVFAATLVADAIVLESGLSFLGLGIQPPAPSWGNILSDGQAQLFAGAWWICFFPGIGIFVSVLALNLVAEGFADSLASANRGMTPDVRVQVVAVSSQAKERDDLLASSERGDLLRVEHLSVSFPDVFGDTNVVSDVSFDLRRGEILSIVGESGCGKSLIGLALMGLLPPGASVTGRAFLNSEDLISMSSRQRRSLLGTKIAMVYQDGLASLNPGMTAGRQLAQACRRGGGARTPVELVEMVGLPRSVLRSYPGQLSGGQRQRVLIGLALAGSPEVLIADEPTTALDETIQAQIVDLLVGLQSKLELSVILVTHDLALAAGVADRVLVMYAGQSVEAGQIAMVVATPHHPYSAGLIAATSALEQGGGMLAPIPGAVPAPSQFPGGCRFQARCSRVEERCAVRVPALVSLTNDQFAACWNPITALSSVLEHALAPDVYE